MIRIVIFLFLIHTSVFAGDYVKSAQWKSGDAAYNDCGFTGVFCTMSTKNVKANRNSISLGQYLTVYANGKEIDSFEVKRIYFEQAEGRCLISKERKKKFKTYFVTFRCRGK
jgi:hypothetical protein